MRVGLIAIVLLHGLYGQTFDPDLLSKEKNLQLQLDFEKNEAQTKILRDSWIEPVNGSYSGSFKEQFGQQQQNYSGSVSIDQPIFKSGGIYYALKYASANAYYNRLGLKLGERALIKEVISSIIALRITDLSIQKARLSVQDREAETAFNKESLHAGEMDLGSFNLSVIARNDAQSALEALLAQKAEQLYTFSMLSDADYQKVSLPQLQLLDKKRFTRTHIELGQMRQDFRQKDYAHGVTLTSYLPQLSLSASYNYSKSIDQTFSESFTPYDAQSEYLQYGFRFSMPLFDINRGRTIESAKIDMLKAQSQLEEKSKEIALFYEKTVTKVTHLKKQAALARETITLYKEVLAKMKALVDSGDKDAIELLKSQNAFKAKKIDLQIIELQKQAELLNLYEKIGTEGTL